MRAGLARDKHKGAPASRQFEPTAQAIRNWVRQADRDDGRRLDGLTTAKQDELRRMRRDNRALREEREILRKSRGVVCAGDQARAAHQAGNALAADVTVLSRELGMDPRRPVRPARRAMDHLDLRSQLHIGAGPESGRLRHA